MAQRIEIALWEKALAQAEQNHRRKTKLWLCAVIALSAVLAAVLLLKH